MHLYNPSALPFELDEIVSGSSKVAKFLGEITLASRDQAVGVEPITEDHGQSDPVTRANTASAEESVARCDRYFERGEAFVAAGGIGIPPNEIINLDDDDFGEF